MSVVPTETIKGAAKFKKSIKPFSVNRISVNDWICYSKWQKFKGIFLFVKLAHCFPLHPYIVTPSHGNLVTKCGVNWKLLLKIGLSPNAYGT